MRRFQNVAFLGVALVILAGSTRSKAAPPLVTPTVNVNAFNADEEAEKIKKNLAKLSEADRKLAEEQKMCPIEDEALGSVGVPIKLTIKGKPVFICCKGCKEGAEKKPDETLKKVEELKKKNKKKD